jgi:hypothetical protein
LAAATTTGLFARPFAKIADPTRNLMPPMKQAMTSQPEGGEKLFYCDGSSSVITLGQTGLRDECGWIVGKQEVTRLFLDLPVNRPELRNQ